MITKMVTCDVCKQVIKFDTYKLRLKGAKGQVFNIDLCDACTQDLQAHINERTRLLLNLAGKPL